MITYKIIFLDLLSQIEKGNLNWMSNGVVERIFEAITGKKHGKKCGKSVVKN